MWATDITYISMARGFLYLVAVRDWYSRYVLAWRLSNTMDTSFCLDALEDALRKGRPEIFNTDQGCAAHNSTGPTTAKRDTHLTRKRSGLHPTKRTPMVPCLGSTAPDDAVDGLRGGKIAAAMGKNFALQMGSFSMEGCRARRPRLRRASCDG